MSQDQSLLSLSKPGVSEPIDEKRRGLLASSAIAMAGSLAPVQSALASASSSIGTFVDQSVMVSAGRLDAQVAAIIKNFQMPQIDPARQGSRFDVDLHRLVTQVTVPETGEKLQVSGLLAIPVGLSGPLPVVSWQHGTILSFDQVPSNMIRLRDPVYQMSDSADSLETLLNVHRFAGQGYAVIAADYIGKGPFRKNRGECYAVKSATVQTCLTVLEVGLSALRNLKKTPGPLFLHGWSQGALNTQWLHQELRRQRRTVVGTVVDSPFNDLSEAWRFWSGNQSFPLPAGASSYPAMPTWVSLCMIVTLGSYEINYGLKGLLQSAVRPEFYELAAKFWSDYQLQFDPSKPFPSGSELLVPGFFDRHTSEVNAAFLRRIAANAATFYRYDAPIRFTYGLADEAIHPAMVGRALAAGGGQAVGVAVPGGSHRGTFVASLYGDAKLLEGRENALEWFNALRR